MYYRKYFFVCNNQKLEGKLCCGAERGANTVRAIREQLQAGKAWGAGKCRTSAVSCLGRCAEGPCFVVYSDGQPERWYRYPDQTVLEAIVRAEESGEGIDQVALYRLPDVLGD